MIAILDRHPLVDRLVGYCAWAIAITAILLVLHRLGVL